MPLITQAGIGSGIDLESIITASVDAERIPKLQAYIAKEESLQVELSAVGEVKSAMSKLEDTIEKLADIGNFNKRTPTLTQPESGDLISVSTNDNSTPGKFNIEVVQLAQGSRISSGGGTYTDNTDVVTASGGNLTLGAGAEAFSINLAAGATLEDLRTAINDANDNFGVTANIVNTGTEAKLVLSSNETGTGNDLTVTGDTAELDGVTTTAFGGGAGGIETDPLVDPTIQVAQGAIIKVDGITINSDSNTFKDAVQDLTITAKAESVGGETATLNVDYDKSGVTTLVDELIANYNNLIGTIGFKTRIGQPLNGDASMRGLKNQMVSALSTKITGAGDFETIFDIGLGIDKEGYLEKSSLVRSLNESLDDKFDDVGEAFAGASGLATNFKSLLENYTESNGLIKLRQDGLNEQLGNLEEDVANHEYRMEQLEIRLRKQYSSLDVLMSNMKSTQTYLSSQLASLPGFTKQNS